MADRNNDTYLNAATLIRRAVQDHLDHSTDVETTFAIRVRELYEAAIEPHASTIHFSDNADPVERMELDRNKVFGMLANTQRRRLPVELEEFVINALPERRRFALQQELASRQGLIAVPVPKISGGNEDANALARVSEEIADVFRTYGALLADGVVNEKDADKAPEALIEIDEAVAVLMSLRERIVRQALVVEHEEVA